MQLHTSPLLGVQADESQVLPQLLQEVVKIQFHTTARETNTQRSIIFLTYYKLNYVHVATLESTSGLMTVEMERWPMLIYNVVRIRYSTYSRHIFKVNTD